jgi:hypothetical protein
MLRKARLLKMHDVLAAAGSGSNEHHASKDRWAVLHHLKRDHSTERVPEDIAPLDAESVKKRHGVSGHFGDSVRNFACRTPQASVVEEDDLPSGREWIGDCGVPVVERAGEVLKKQQR